MDYLIALALSVIALCMVLGKPFIVQFKQEYTNKTEPIAPFVPIDADKTEPNTDNVEKDMVEAIQTMITEVENNGQTRD